MGLRERKTKKKSSKSSALLNNHELPPCKNAANKYYGDILIFKINDKEQPLDYSADEYSQDYQELFFKDELSDSEEDEDEFEGEPGEEDLDVEPGEDDIIDEEEEPDDEMFKNEDLEDDDEDGIDYGEEGEEEEDESDGEDGEEEDGDPEFAGENTFTKSKKHIKKNCYKKVNQWVGRSSHNGR